MKNCSPIRGAPQQKWSRNSEEYWIRRPQSKDEDLALFHDMRMLENKNFLHPSTDDMEASLRLQICVSPTPAWKGNDLLAMAEAEKTDYDWLLTPPGTPLFPSLDKDSWQNYMGRCVISQSYSASKGSRCLGSGTPEPQRPGRTSPGPWTPTSTASSISSSHSASRARAPSPSRIGSSPTLRPSTPSKALGRSTTVMNRTSTRSSPPILRRTNTSPSPRSTSVEKNATLSKPRNSGSQKLQAWQAPELGFSAEPPPNLRTSLSDRPVSGLRSGSGRPRIGAQEARQHQQSRHSYSDALETRRSYLRTSSSSISRLSSSTTTSQDRWSSRGSMFSSSDDGLDALEPPFMGFCATSISSTSGTDNNVSERLDNELTSRCSPVNRQKKAPVLTMETARFSASTRKPLDSCMQRADHNRLPQTMFRPLMCNAPTTSYFNIGRSVARHKPANFFVEPSITASSNASSERGARIFPGNESSEEEVESGWDRSVRTTSSTSKFNLNESDVEDANSHPTHDLTGQYEQESVVDDASTTLDRCGKESVMPLCSYNQAMNCCDDQESRADLPFSSNSNDVQNISACLHSDPINLHLSDCGQKETEMHDVCCKDSIPYAAKDTDCENANRESTTTSAASLLGRHRNAPDGHCAEKIRMDPTVLKSTSDSLYIQEGSLYSENHISSLNVWAVVELPLTVHGSPLDFPQDTFVQGIEKSPHKCACLLEEASTIENISASSDSVIAGIRVLGHVQSDQLHSGAPIIEDQKSSRCLEPQGDMSSLSFKPKSEQSSCPAGEMKYSLEASSGRDYTTTPQEVKESNALSKSDCFATLEKHCLMVNEEYSDSKIFLSTDETEVCALEYDQEIDVESEGIKGHNDTLLGNEFVIASSEEDKENFPSYNALFPEILDPGLQDNEHCSNVSNSAAESSIDCSMDFSLVADFSKEELSSNAASLQSIPQFSGDLQPDCSLDPSLPQEDTQARTLSMLQDSGVESTANEVTPPNETDSLQQPQRGPPLKSSAESYVHIAAKPSFSLEEATNTILFCSSIIHDIVYEAASIATEKEAEAMKVELSLVPQSRGLNANSAFISSLREKMSKSATWKPRHKDAKAFSVKLQKEEVALPITTITDCPTSFLAMVREPARVDNDKPVTDNAKDKSFMGISVNNCQCSIM